ncbi:hypothetical protein GCM10028828_07800 [Corynebacterium tapiri]
MPGEQVRADLTSSPRVMVFPVIELVATTGLLWMAIGFLDSPASPFPDQLRNLFVVAWMLAVLLRFVVPLVRARRRRFIVTNRRVIARQAQLRGRVDSIPFADIHSVRRRKGGLSVAILGQPAPLFYPEVPKSRRVEEMINRSLPPRLYR